MVLANVFSAKVLNIFPVPYFIVVVAFPTAILLFLLIFLSFPGSIRESTGFKFIKLKAFAGEEALRARALRANSLLGTRWDRFVRLQNALLTTRYALIGTGCIDCGYTRTHHVALFTDNLLSPAINSRSLQRRHGSYLRVLQFNLPTGRQHFSMHAVVRPPPYQVRGENQHQVVLHGTPEQSRRRPRRRLLR